MSSEIDHKSLFDAMPVPRFLVAPTEDRKFIIKEMNHRAFEYFNRRPEQVLGRAVQEFMDGENARHFEQSFEVCAKQRMPVTIQVLPNFPGGIRVYGFWINPLLDMATGKVVLMDVMAQPDSQDDSILQRERDDAISLLTSVFEASEVGIIVTDRHRRVVRVNDAFVRNFGWPKDEIIGEDYAILFLPDEKEDAQKTHDDNIAGGMRSTGEGRIQKYDSSIADVLYTTAILELSQRRRFQVITMIDISLRKQMEISLRLAKDQADTANQAKSAFLANMSHELRTPLNAIIGFSEMMIKETFGPMGHKKYYEYLEDMHYSANHLLEIINEVLDMSKIEAGRVELDEQIFNIAELMDTVVRMMSSRAFSSGIAFDVTLDDKLPNVNGDPRLLRQVFINLISNAVKFSKPGGTITVGAGYAKDGDLVIEVRDQGVGIRKEKIKAALEPFGQIPEAFQTSRQDQGTGLGLPIAKAMVEMHGGELRLESEYGVGTVVTVSVPAFRLVKA